MRIALATPLLFGLLVWSARAAMNAPSNLTANATSPTSISLAWKDNATDEAAYQIWRSANGNTFFQIGSVARNGTRFTVGGLSPNTKYWFKVRAVNGTVLSNYSNTAAETTPTAPASPSPTATPTPTATPSTPTPTPPPPTPSPSPTIAPGGGLASKYPNDAGIGSDPAVIIADDFESYTDTNGFLKHGWTLAGPLNLMMIDTNQYFGGHKSVRMSIPPNSAETTIHITKRPSVDTVFIRAYEKWAGSYDMPGSNHNGLHVKGGTVTAGTPPSADGTSGFTTMLQNVLTKVAGETSPGYDHVYVYWPHQRDNFGDHWLPNGNVIPGGAGDWLRYPAQYPDFKVMPMHQPQLDRWYCYELMVKLNTIGKNDGEVKWWCDGVVIADFPHLFFRGIATLKVDDTRIELHSWPNPTVLTKWYDNVVIATQYIGPMATGTPAPTPSPSPTGTPTTPTPTASPSPTPTATATATPTPETPTPTPTLTPTPTASPTPTPSPSPTATPTATPVQTRTVTVHIMNPTKGHTYELYYGEAPTVYGNCVATLTGAVSAGIPDLIVGKTYYFANKVKDENGIYSVMSDPVAYTVTSAETQQLDMP